MDVSLGLAMGFVLYFLFDVSTGCFDCVPIGVAQGFQYGLLSMCLRLVIWFAYMS